MLIPILLSKYVGIKNAFAIQNLILMVLSGPLMYFLSKKLMNNEKIALFSSIFFLSSFPVLYWGFAVLTDMPVFFFFILTTYIIINFFEKNIINPMDTIQISLICSFGFLFKFHMIIMVLFFYTLLLMRGNFFYENLKEKLVHSLLFGFIYLIPLVIFDLITSSIVGAPFITTFVVDHFFGGNGNDGLFAIISPPLQAHQWPIYLIETFLIAFGVTIPFALFELYKSTKSRQRTNKLIYVSFLFSVFLPLAVLFAVMGFGLTPRFTFLIFPIFLPCAASGFSKSLDLFSVQYRSFEKERFAIIFLAIYVIVNNAVWFFSDTIRDYLGLATEDLWGT